MIKSLKDIPRIGEKTARRFIERFGSEEMALDAILSGDIAGISEIEGITEKTAISIVLEALSANEDIRIGDFLKTGEAYGIYERILDLVCDSAHTDYARNKMRLYFPYPSGKKDKIARQQERTAWAIGIAGKLEEKELVSFLSRIKPIKTNYSIPVIRDRVIIASTQQEFEAAKNFPVSVQLATDAREIVDIARGYSHAFISTAFTGFDYPEDIDVDFIDIKRIEMWQVAPEKELAFFAKNHESISNAISVFNIIRLHNAGFCGNISDDSVKRLSLGLSKISHDSGLKSGIDCEIDRCQLIYNRLNEVISAAEKKANYEFGSLIENSSITVKGFDLLNAMKGSINSLFEKEIKEKYNAVTDSTVSEISAELKLNAVESQFVNNFFGDEVSHPLKVDSRGVEMLKNHLLRAICSRKLVLLRDNARELSRFRETASDIVRGVLDFDVDYTIGCFARKFALGLPCIRDETGIGFEGGTNLFLESPVPISYAVGRVNSGMKRLKGARVVLLSGVNSGGKTSTIELLAQIIILSHMGFPVPAKKCEIGLVDEFFYFGKSKGTMDAGAFESTIRDFSGVANKNKKIVLADEMESITEPGASAKIISGILEELLDNNGLGVFVSHLAESILKNTDYDIRVDGIEAKGLDENLNLIVDRNPRYNYLARSTPELIVERLARKYTDNGFYSRLLRKFK